uniref:Uncharacterized protein n=1 Tax=Polytomella parva TaxID=51329 RepID=A0A7S0YRY9_9CHLO|mmetsp:Transcript_34279/g.61849  ORF Transcript_34279/g.61849 Transcript_34279/m.61849 type:complete len:166 (+) Transcript_34279:489-986(+)
MLYNKVCLLKRNEPGRVGRTNTRATVLTGLVRNGELSKIVTNHIGLDLNLVKGLSIVNTDNIANHLGNNKHAAEVSADRVGLLTLRGSLLHLSKLLDKSGTLSAEATRKATTSTGMKEANKLLILEVKELVKVYTAVAKLAEGPGNFLLSISHFYSNKKEGKKKG